ncbi:MAG: site-specific integrase [Planctomycetes bacterium]|nr:site-specific integrase [Planctomycetota bacterium]
MVKKQRAETERFPFRKTKLQNLPVPSKRTYYHDATVPGLALCITPAGTRTFYLYKWAAGRPVKMPLGRFPDVTVEQARKKARKLVGAIADGVDPTEARREARGEATLEALFLHWMEVYSRPHKKTAWQDEWQYKRFLTRWAGRRLSAIKKADVQALHSRVGRENGHYAANRLLALLGSMFAKADELGYRGDNPTKGVTLFKEQSRDRFLQPDELPRFFEALNAEPDGTVRDFFLMCLLTGGRRGNVQAMRWDQLGMDGTWRIPDTKGGRPVYVPLVALAMQILQARRDANPDGEWVFPGPGKTGHLIEVRRPWKRICERAEIADLRIHDLRRTLGSWQVATGASLPIIAKMLGHGEGSRSTAVYSRLSLDPVRESAQKATSAMLAAGGMLEGPKEEEGRDDED